VVEQEVMLVLHLKQVEQVEEVEFQFLVFQFVQQHHIQLQ
jgi:hypothetical protein